MTSKAKTTIGPELGIGFTLANYTSEPVMTLKSCIGDRALGWDLLPPGVKQSTFGNYTYAGYHDSPEKWLTGTPKPQPMASKPFNNILLFCVLSSVLSLWPTLAGTKSGGSVRARSTAEHVRSMSLA